MLANTRVGLTRLRLVALSFAALAALATGCVGDSDGYVDDCGDVGGSCLESSGEVCTEYKGDATAISEAITLCDTGTWSASACSRTNNVGGCRINSSDAARCAVVWIFVGTDAENMSICADAGGTWIP